ncbi:hypothetical protein [Chryseobacterium balustinum]|uniref:Uncharacterized protein n=1 Tax=Chryseobacterium balustinum TaxID=246 RepID=A0AAX2IS13_9FLAO|nr:hypothetical protein [Chryseobacterium balustinum]AZB28178.1 hypothetical protein EB354_02235 [Chryseobacterium balustinum]SKC11717.1 hypothetical protein SAMN05421800_13617 [Chryseobacterium balustinum]SQA92401.1 Uncharacterised protein [Chryseobacterium balustinum]
MNQSEVNEIQELNSFKYAWYRNGKYSVNVKSYLTLGNGEANETETEEIWEIIPGEYKHIDLLISDKKYIHFDAQMKPFYEILDQVNKATENLALLLSEDKTIDKIENEEEIIDKWEEIKRKELRFLQLVKDSYNEIINIYDKEFQRIDDNIKANLLYQILFYPFPNTGVNFTNEGQFKEREFLSTLFPGEKIVYDTNYQFVDNKDKFQMNIKGNLKSHTGDFDEIYAQNYQKALNIPLEYDLMMEGEYIYNLDSVLSEIVFHVKEKLNEKMLYVCRYHIQLIP